MVRFSKYIVGGLIAILIVMLVLDVVYTKIYETAYPRTKFQYLRSLKDKKVDYIFIGSSRVENGIVPSVIEEKIGKKAINFGFQAAKLGDIYTLLQLIKEYNIHCQKVLIQVDYIYNIVDGHSNIFEYEMSPFIRENAITKRYSDQYAKHPIADYYIPFYRYCHNDLKIGFREVFANMVHKNTAVIANNGYRAFQGSAIKMGGALPDVILERNIILENIQSFAKQNKMEVVFYCAPFCKYNRNQNFTMKLKTKIPGLLDFSKVINDDALFLNCNHLNDRGAKRFTEILTEQLLMRKSK
jgi:hypothetical protein